MKEVKMLNFVKLQLLQTLWQDDARWQDNVKYNIGTDGWTLASDGDDGDPIVERFALRDMKRAEGVCVYDFMGSSISDERFYMKDVVVYKRKDNTLWVEETDDVYEF